MSRNLEFELKCSKSKVRCNLNAIVISLILDPCSAFEICTLLIELKTYVHTRSECSLGALSFGADLGHNVLVVLGGIGIAALTCLLLLDL